MFALLLFAQLSVFQPIPLQNSTPTVLGENTVNTVVSQQVAVARPLSATKRSSPHGTELGRLIIDTPDLKIESPIISGVGMLELARGIGHHTETPLPGEQGNSGLACHRWYPGANPNYTLCLHLDKLKVGDKIEAHYSDQRYVFQVEWTKVVGPDAVEILNPTDYPALTLYTCTPIYTATQRLVYHARLISSD